ncbi:hypothetical protein PMAYCL1PPCAC_10081, partial [Pristionchus mayeri]
VLSPSRNVWWRRVRGAAGGVQGGLLLLRRQGRRPHRSRAGWRRAPRARPEPDRRGHPQVLLRLARPGDAHLLRGLRAHPPVGRQKAREAYGGGLRRGPLALRQGGQRHDQRRRAETSADDARRASLGRGGGPAAGRPQRLPRQRQHRRLCARRDARLSLPAHQRFEFSRSARNSQYSFRPHSNAPFLSLVPLFPDCTPK